MRRMLAVAFLSATLTVVPSALAQRTGHAGGHGGSPAAAWAAWAAALQVVPSAAVLDLLLAVLRRRTLSPRRPRMGSLRLRSTPLGRVIACLMPRPLPRGVAAAVAIMIETATGLRIAATVTAAIRMSTRTHGNCCRGTWGPRTSSTPAPTPGLRTSSSRRHRLLHRRKGIGRSMKAAVKSRLSAAAGTHSVRRVRLRRSPR